MGKAYASMFNFWTCPITFLGFTNSIISLPRLDIEEVLSCLYPLDLIKKFDNMHRMILLKFLSSSLSSLRRWRRTGMTSCIGINPIQFCSNSGKDRRNLRSTTCINPIPRDHTNQCPIVVRVVIGGQRTSTVPRAHILVIIICTNHP